MRRKYIKKEFIDSPNKILCDYCEKEISENKIRCRGLGVKICTNCIKKREEWINQQRIKKPNQKQFVYPHRPYVVRINENQVDKDALNEFFKLLGYDATQDIHKQFLERHNL